MAHEGLQEDELLLDSVVVVVEVVDVLLDHSVQSLHFLVERLLQVELLLEPLSLVGHVDPVLAERELACIREDRVLLVHEGFSSGAARQELLLVLFLELFEQKFGRLLPLLLYLPDDFVVKHRALLLRCWHFLPRQLISQGLQLLKLST